MPKANPWSRRPASQPGSRPSMSSISDAPETIVASHDTLIVVGIDFGTTHSGVSWAVNEGKKKVNLIRNWRNPSAPNANIEKVPSRISYKDGIVYKWGYEVSTKEESFKWVKLLLEPNERYSETTMEVKQSNELLNKLGMTADEVVRDYLKELWQYTRQEIYQRVDEKDWESVYKCLIVLTVPAIWSDRAKDRTVTAAKEAGLPNDIRIVTEPEAAALATLKDRAEESKLRPGDAFVICDAGGGTVDLISYRVISVDPLRLVECVEGDGGLCGSAFLDLKFERHIVGRVGKDDYEDIKPTHKNKMQREFEYGVKRSFDGSPNQDYSVDLKGVKDNEKEGIRDDNIPLTLSALKTIFDEIYDEIDDLIRTQVNKVQENDLEVKSILLVGGFGENRYIYNRLEATYRPKGIRVLQMEGAWSAVSRGACLWGLEQLLSTNAAESRPESLCFEADPCATLGTITARISRYSYGIAFMESFDSTKHEWEDRCVDESTGETMAGNQMYWMLKRGESYEVGQTLERTLTHSVSGVKWRLWGRTRTRMFDQTLYVSDQLIPSTRLDESVKPLCVVTFHIPETKICLFTRSYKSPIDGTKWRDTKFVFVVTLRNAILEFAARHRNSQIGYTVTKYGIEK